MFVPHEAQHSIKPCLLSNYVLKYNLKVSEFDVCDMGSGHIRAIFAELMKMYGIIDYLNT